MSATRTRSGTQTGTLSKIVYVARKVEADLLAIIDTYCYGSEQWAINVMHDVRVLMDEEVIERATNGDLPAEPHFAEWLVLLGRSELVK